MKRPPSNRQKHSRNEGAPSLEWWKSALLVGPTVTLLMLPFVVDACGAIRLDDDRGKSSEVGIHLTKSALSGLPPTADQVLTGKILPAVGFPATGGGMQIADSTPGSANVEADGSTSYDVPVWVPDGVRGMQPSLSIHYNSNANLGLLGKRWTIGGLSVITRCGKTPRSDSRPGPIDFINGDEFCLDSQRMQRFSGATPNSVGEFRIPQNPFQKIVAVDSDNTGILSFKVFQRDGRIFEYGRSTNSRLFGSPVTAPGTPTLPSGVVSTYAYYLDRVQDRYGNSMLVTYKHPGISASVVNDVYPATITWGGVGDAVGQRSAAFTYANEPSSPIDTRGPDGDRVHVGGLGIRRGERLTSLKIYGPGGPDAVGGSGMLKAYNFTYSAPTITGEQLLATISECDGASICKQPTKITWELGANTYTKNPTPRSDGLAISDVVIPASTQIPATCPSGSGVCQQTYQRIMFADVNADGRDDLIYRGFLTAGCLGWGVRLAQPNGTFAATPLNMDLGTEMRCSDAFSPSQQKYGPNPNDPVFADMNQDGAPDVVTTNANTLTFSSINVHLNTNPAAAPGFGFAASPTFSDATSNPVFSIGDLDGNGIPELIVRGAGTNAAWHGTSMIPVTNGVRPVLPLVSPVTPSPALALQIAAFDLDGDGMAEVVQPTSLLGNNGKTYCGPAVCGAGQFCYISGLPRRIERGFDSYGGMDTDPGMCKPGCWSDFNCVPPQVCSANNVSATQPTVGVCQSGPSVPYNSWVSSPTMNGGMFFPYSASLTARFMLDFNRDGLPDIAYVSALPGTGAVPPTSIQVATNVGAGFFARAPTSATQALPLGAQIGQSWRSGFEPGVRVTDFNGDGRQDLMLVDNGANATGVATRTRLTVLIANSFGEFTAFTPSTSTGAAIPIGDVADGLVSAPSGRITGHHGYRTSMLGDFNGDGLTDLAQLEGGKLVTYIRDGNVPDVVSNVLEGTGRGITASYVDLGFSAIGGIANSISGVYTRDPASCAGNRRNLICATRGRLVTARLSVGSAKAGSVSTQAFAYKGAVSDRGGAGFLGFVQRDITGPAPTQHTRIVSNVTSMVTLPGVPGYFFPRALKPETITTDIDTSQGTNRHHLDVVTYSYSVAAAGTASSLPSFGSIAVLPSGVIETSSDCPGIGSCTGPARQLSRKDQTYTYDAYGNVKTATTVYTASGTSPIQTDTVVNDYYPADTVNWLNGMPSQTVVTSVVPASQTSTTTRTTKFIPDFATGEIASIEIEPTGTESTHLIRSFYRDSRGRMEAMVDTSAVTGEARTTTFTYEDYDGVYVSYIINALGHRTRIYRHPGLGVPVATADPNGVMVAQTYDTFARPLATTGSSGAVTTAISYRAPPAATVGGVDLVVTPENVSTRAATIHLDSFGREESRRASVDSRQSLQYTETYDNVGRVLTVSEQSLAGTAGAPILNTETRTYDNIGRLLGSCHLVADGTNKCLTNTYDGLSVTTTNEAGRVTTNIFDALGRPSIQRASILKGTSMAVSDAKFSYGGFGLFEKESFEDGHNVTSVTYDRLGRPSVVMRTGKAGAQVTGIARRTTYNAFGDVVSTAKARYVPQSETYFWSDVLTFGRDLLGRPTSETGAGLDAPLNVINRRFVWDQTFVEGIGLTYIPNGIGKLNDVITGSMGGVDNSGGVPYTNCSDGGGGANLCADPNAVSQGCPGHQPNWGTELCGGICVSKRWDDLNCGSCGTVCGMGSFCDTNWQDPSHGICNAGRASIPGAGLRTALHFDYESTGQVSQKTWIIDDPTAVETETGRLTAYVEGFTYDSQGRLDTVIYPQNPNSSSPPLTVQYGYDSYTGTALTIRDVANPATPIWQVTSRSERGQVKTEQLNLGVALTHTTGYFTPTGMIKTSRFDGTSGQYAQVSYTYQSDGLPSTFGVIGAGVGGATTSSFTSSYINDNLGRLTSWTANTGAPPVAYKYDDGGELLSRSWSGETVTYSGIAAGSNTSRTVSTQRGTTAAQIDTYEMDTFGRIFDTPAASFTWNAEDKIVGVTEKDSGSRDTIVYDGLGQRVLTLFSDGDKGKLVTLDDLYEQSVQGFDVTERRHLYADGRIVGDLLGSSAPYTANFYLEDNTHSVAADISSGGVVRARAPRDPFGNAFTSASTPYLPPEPIASDPDGGSREAFGGHPRDRNWGVVDMLARHYSPRLGRFLSADAILGDAWDRRAHNPYSYAYNSPTSLWDPSGNDPDPPPPNDPNPPPPHEGDVGLGIAVVLALPIIVVVGAVYYRHEIAADVENGASKTWSGLKDAYDYFFGSDAPTAPTLANTVATVSVANGGSQVQGDSAATSAGQGGALFPNGVWGSPPGGLMSTPEIGKIADQVQFAQWASEGGLFIAGMVGGPEGAAARGAVGVAERVVTRGAGGVTKLFRAVSEGEFKQLMSTGKFSAGPNSLGGKFFAETAEHAGKWGEAMMGKGNFHIIEAELPTSAANNLMRWERLDGIGPARYGELEQLVDAVVRAFK